MNNDSFDQTISENWQRFMILWSITPEFFIGSCIICIFSVLSLFCLSKFSCCRRAEGNNEHTHEHREITDELRNESSTLRNRKKPLVVKDASTNEIHEMPPVQEEEDDDSRTSPFRRSRYTLAAEKVKSTLSEDQLKEEREIQRKQLQAIFELMKDKSDIFGIQEMAQIEEQLKYYS